MSEPCLIRDYLAALSTQLPASVTDELADGLVETYRSYQRRGLAPDAAARSAVAEFGDPRVIVAEFALVNPARRVARYLLVTSPVVGACWTAALITSGAWTWPVPLPVRILLGLVLVIVVTLNAVAARGTRYRLATRAVLAGCLAVTVLDISMITGTLLLIPAMTWVASAAVVASAVRIAYSTRNLRPLLAR